jgi:uncharacterized protein (TIGR02996 family)
MTDEERGFLAKITAEPDDDTHRLVYADWLEENGRPERAEFIRLQVAIDRLEADEPRGKDSMWLAGYRLARHRNESVFAALAGDPCRCILCLQSRERELLDARVGANGSDNAFIWAGSPAFQFDAMRYRRGFVEELAGAAEDVIPRLDDLRRRHPLRRVDLTTDPGGHWEGDSVGDAAVFVLPDCPRTVTELEVLASRRELGTWVDGDPETYTPHSLPDVLAALWPGISFEVPVGLAHHAGVHETTTPAEAGDHARTFFVAGMATADPAAVTRMPGVANGARWPDGDAFRARTFVSQRVPGGWAVRIEYEHEPQASRLFARVDAATEVEIPSLGWLISAEPEDEPEFSLRPIRAQARWQPRSPRAFLLECESGPPFHEPPPGVLGATFGPVTARDAAGALYTVPRARVRDVVRVESSPNTWGRVRYHAVAESEPSMLTPE